MSTATRKIFVYAILLMGVAFQASSCEQKPTKPPRTEAKNVVQKDTAPMAQWLVDLAKKDSQKVEEDTFVMKYSEAEVLHFLDSIGRIPASKLDDSVDFTGLPPKGMRRNKLLGKTQFKALQNGCKAGWISRNLADELVPDRIVFAEKISDSIPIEYYPFDSVSGFQYFAIEFYPIQAWASTVAFFDGNRLVEYHEVAHRYGLTMDSYLDGQGRRFVHYARCMSAGAGAAEFRDCYFYWDKWKLIPSLETLRLGSWSGGPRMYTLSSELKRLDALRILMKYEHALFNPDSLREWIGAQTTIINDSSTVLFTFDTLSHRYCADWSGSRLTKPQMLSYFNVENDLLFVQTHHRLLKRILSGKDSVKRRSVQFYLCEVMDGNYPKGGSAKR